MAYDFLYIVSEAGIKNLIQVSVNVKLTYLIITLFHNNEKILSSERRNSRPKGSPIFRRILFRYVSKILSFDWTHMIKEGKDQRRGNR